MEQKAKGPNLASDIESLLGLSKPKRREEKTDPNRPLTASPANFTTNFPASPPIHSSGAKDSLSLGLEALLSLAQQSEPTPKSSDAGPVQKAKNFYQDDNFSQLSITCELSLGDPAVSQEDQAVLKLYWILAKLKLGSIPPSVLLSNFEEAISALSPNQRVDAELLEDLKKSFDEKLRAPLLKTNLLGIASPVTSAMTHSGEVDIGQNHLGTDTRYHESRGAAAGHGERKLKAISAKRVLALIALLGLLVGGGLYLTFIKPDLFSPATQPLVWDLLDTPQQDKAVLPELTPLPAPGALDAVLYGLKNSSSSSLSTERGNNSDSPGNGSARIDTQSSTREANSASNASSAKKISTDSPNEPAEITSIRNSPPSAENRSDSDEAPSHSQDTGRIVDGGVALPPQFKEFSESRFYTIRRETSVRSDPSLRSEAYAVLKKGIRIEVVGQQGYWLKVKSRSGRIGFVLAEDAAIEADWNTNQ